MYTNLHIIIIPDYSVCIIAKRLLQTNQHQSTMMFIPGLNSSSISIYKDGKKLVRSDSIKIDLVNSEVVYNKPAVSQNDRGSYSVKVDNRDEDRGEVLVQVVSPESGVQ